MKLNYQINTSSNASFRFTIPMLHIKIQLHRHYHRQIIPFITAITKLTPHSILLEETGVKSSRREGIPTRGQSHRKARVKAESSSRGVLTP